MHTTAHFVSWPSKAIVNTLVVPVSETQAFGPHRRSNISTEHFSFGLHEHRDRWAQLAAIPILVTSKANRDIKHKNFGDQRGCCHLRNLHCTLEKQDGTYENNFTAPKITTRAQVAGHSSETSIENPEITIAEGIV